MRFERWEHVAGRGWIAIMHSETPQDEIKSLQVGSTQLIDGREYLIVGIECSVGLSYGKYFGLLIRGEPAEHAS